MPVSYTSGLNRLASGIHQWAISNGFYEPEKVRDFDGMLMNVVTEVAEAQEEWRDGRDFNEIYYKEGSDKPEGIPTELADIIIRVLDICAYHGIDIEKALDTKIDYNRTRAYRNGGKRS